jgi:hypothetical protein
MFRSTLLHCGQENVRESWPDMPGSIVTSVKDRLNQLCVRERHANCVNWRVHDPRRIPARSRSGRNFVSTPKQVRVTSVQWPPLPRPLSVVMMSVTMNGMTAAGMRARSTAATKRRRHRRCRLLLQILASDSCSFRPRVFAARDREHLTSCRAPSPASVR